jgi:hypothetical protein
MIRGRLAARLRSTPKGRMFVRCTVLPTSPPLASSPRRTRLWLFTPDERHAARTERMIRGTVELFERVKQAGALRPGMTFLDVAFLLEMLAKTRLGDDNRTAELKQRQLAIIIDGLRTDRAASLPGAPPTWEEQESRWNSA